MRTDRVGNPGITIPQPQANRVGPACSSPPVWTDAMIFGNDHAAIDLLAGSLRCCEPSIRVEWSVFSDRVAAGNSDLIVIDVDGQSDGGESILRYLRSCGRHQRTILMARNIDQRTLLKVLAAGADGFLCKADGRDDVVRALQTARDGGPALTSTVAAELVAYARTHGAANNSMACEYCLTGREREIISLADKGYTFPQTAELIGIRVSTVYTHVRRMYEKMSVNSLPQALFEARRTGLL